MACDNGQSVGLWLSMASVRTWLEVRGNGETSLTADLLFFLIQTQSLRIEGVLCCADCKTLSGKFLICDCGLYK